MEIEQLREFVLLSKTLNFTKTARELNLSQPALSTHIMKLEKELGVTLIDRDQQNPHLTAAGSEFLETAYLMLNAYNKFLDKARDPHAFSQGHFTIQTLQHVNTTNLVLLKRTRAFKKEHPGVVIDIHESLEFNAAENIHNGQTDCGYYGLYLHEPEAQPGLNPILLTHEEFVVWVDVSSPLCNIESLTPSDLADITVPVWVGPPNDLDGLCREFFATFGVKVTFSPRYCTSREDFFLNHIRKNDTVILTKGCEDIHAIRANDDRVLLCFDPPLYANSYLAIRDDEDNEALVAFAEFVAEHANDNDF